MHLMAHVIIVKMEGRGQHGCGYKITPSGAIKPPPPQPPFGHLVPQGRFYHHWRRLW